MDITDRIVLITGAGSGIGRALAVRMIDRGARHVVCTDLDGANVEETATMIGDKATGCALDVSSESAIEEAIAHLRGVGGELGDSSESSRCGMSDCVRHGGMPA